MVELWPSLALALSVRLTYLPNTVVITYQTAWEVVVTFKLIACNLPSVSGLPLKVRKCNYVRQEK